VAKKNAVTKKGKPKASTQLAPLKLTGKLFFEYRAAMAELFESRTRLELCEERLRAEMRDEKYAPLLRLQSARNESLRGVAGKQTVFKDVQERVCKKVGIPRAELEKYTINEYSGAVVFTPPKGDE
jgi:hypothetical protein